MEMGISVRPDVLSTRNMIIAFEAVTFSSSASVFSPLAFNSSIFPFFNSCNCSIAFRPSGVAALSRPSMLAAMFMKMEPVTG